MAARNRLRSPQSTLSEAKDLVSLKDGKALIFSDTSRVRSILENRIPWTICTLRGVNRINMNFPPFKVPNRKWKVAVVGVHPSLSADFAFAVDAALQGRTERQYFGLSCPAHYSAVHHCSFRCEVFAPELRAFGCNACHILSYHVLSCHCHLAIACLTLVG